jgi:MFS family permease
VTVGLGPSFELFGIEVQLPRTFAALKHRNYRLFWSGQIISLIGTWMQTVGQGWLVLSLTNSPFKLGFVSMAGSLPILLFTLWGGVVADRVNKRNLILFTQSSAMTLAFILAALTSFKVVQVWHIVMLAFMLGTVNSFDTPSRQAFIVEMVGKEDLTNAIGLNSAMFNTARMVGPAIAGLLIAALGVAGCFWLNGVSFIAVIIGLALIRNTFQPEHREGGSPLKNLLEGLRYLWAHKVLLAIIANIGVSSVFGMPYVMLMPVFAKQILKGGPSTYGVLLAAAGAGAIVGGLTVATRGARVRQGAYILFGSGLFAVFIFLFSFSHWLWLSLALLFVAGFAMITQNVTTNSLIQTAVPDFLRGRIMSVYVLVFMGMFPLGSLQAGSVAQVLGAPWAVRIGAVMCGLFALFLWRIPEIRKLR